MKAVYFTGIILSVVNFISGQFHDEDDEEEIGFKTIDSSEIHLASNTELCEYISPSSEVKVGKYLLGAKNDFDLYIPNHYKDFGSVTKVENEIKINLDKGKTFDVVSKNVTNLTYIEFEAQLNFNDKANYLFALKKGREIVELGIESKDQGYIYENYAHGNHYHDRKQELKFENKLNDKKNIFALSFMDRSIQIFINGHLIKTVDLKIRKLDAFFFSIMTKDMSSSPTKDSTMIITSVKVPCPPKVDKVPTGLNPPKLYKCVESKKSI